VSNNKLIAVAKIIFVADPAMKEVWISANDPAGAGRERERLRKRFIHPLPIRGIQKKWPFATPLTTETFLLRGLGTLDFPRRVSCWETRSGRILLRPSIIEDFYGLSQHIFSTKTFR
jgi:hypothetical protein